MALSGNTRPATGSTDDVDHVPETGGRRSPRIRERADAALWDLRQTHFDRFEVAP